MASKKKLENGDPQAVLTEWLGRLEDLVKTVQTWATELDWSTRRITKKMKEPELGVYQAPALLLQFETVRLLLEPIARDVPGAEGTVDLYAMPAYDDLATLVSKGGKWKLHRDWHTGPEGRHIELPPETFTKKAFAKFLEDMKIHVAEPL